MEKSMDWEQQRLVKELRQGRELTNLLREHLNHPCSSSSSPQTRHALLDKILRTYEKSLSMLNWTTSAGFHFPPEGTKPNATATATATATLESPASIVNSSPAGSEANCDRKDHVFKKRKTSSGWSEQVKVCSGTSLEGPLDDGYCWRKYGQKDILGSSYPRGYYRCTHRHSQGCLATKQVQRSDEDPTIFEVKYRGRHTCIQASHFAAVTSKDKGNQSRQKQQLEEKQKQSQEIMLSFGAGFKVKAEELDNRDDEEVFPSFSFPFESQQVDNNSRCMFVTSIMDNDIMMGNLSPTFMSPATSESNYFSVSPCHITGSFGLGQNVRTPESDLTEIMSAPTSVTNSPIGDLDISSLEDLEFDPNLSFDSELLFF